MPNQPRSDNPARGIRVPDALWHAAKRRAGKRGETVTAVVIRALDEYVRPDMTAGGSPNGPTQNDDHPRA